MEDHSMEGPGGAQWAPDPYRRHELRYWDGSRWTEHVSEGDGSVLVDPPVPRFEREAAMASSGGLRRVTPVQTPAGFDASAVGLEEKSPDVVPEPARAQRRAARQTGRQDLFNDLPGGRRAAGVETASRPDTAIGGDDGGLSMDRADKGWDWRESHLPEILSGLGVAALIAGAALLGGRGTDEGAVRSIVSPPASGAAAVATTMVPPKKPKKSLAPEIKVSSAKAPRITPRSGSSTEPRETTRPTRTTTRSPRPTATNSPSDTPSPPPPPPTSPPPPPPPPPPSPSPSDGPPSEPPPSPAP